jgi:hypothetical protein
MSKTTKHHWYGDSSPYQHSERRHDFDGPQTESASDAVIWDRENPPQLRSSRAPIDWDDRNQ